MNNYFQDYKFIELYEQNNYNININYFLKTSIFIVLLSIKYAFHGSEIIVNIDNNFDQKLY
jgi:hypothetical protein